MSDGIRTHAFIYITLKVDQLINNDKENNTYIAGWSIIFCA
jgi:hypothetical protein